MKLKKKLITAPVGLTDKTPRKLSVFATGERKRRIIKILERWEKQSINLANIFKSSQLAMVVGWTAGIECNLIPL